MKQTLKTMLEVKMEKHTWVIRNTLPKAAEPAISRNGAMPKTIRGDFGEVAIETPWDRNGDFDPKAVARRLPLRPYRLP